MFTYIAKHWRGEFPLPQSYWLNGVLLLLPFNLYLRIVSAVFVASPPQSPAIYVFAFLMPYVAFQPFAVWAGIGIWRSAGRRIAEGRPAWGWIARLVIAANLVFLLFADLSTARVNYAVLLAYFDERAATYEVTAHGNYVVFHGEITDAGVSALEPLLNDAKVRRFVINGSVGGFVTPALRLAKIVHDRHLFVVALAQCDSSCTVLLAAGDVRAVTPDTELGFHLGTLAGLDDRAKGWDSAEDYYAKAGMPHDMIVRIRDHHGPWDFYEPPLRALIESGFLTDIFVEQSKLYVPARQWCALNKPACDRTGRQNRTPMGGAHGG